MSYTAVLPIPDEKDTANRYASTVVVFAKVSDSEKRQCSGVALDRRLILTAGHCVCAFRKSTPPQHETLIDGSDCASRAVVETVSYESDANVGDGAIYRTQLYSGKVKPHPSFKAVLGAEGVVSSTADLAVIRLDKPLKREVPTVPLAKTDVQPAESVTLVGHGYNELEDVFDEERYFSQNKIIQVSAGEDRIPIEQPGKHLYRLDSGGPCLRKEGQKLTLVGISSRWLGRGAAFTSTYANKDWISEQVRHARGVDSD